MIFFKLIFVLDKKLTLVNKLYPYIILEKNYFFIKNFILIITMKLDKLRYQVTTITCCTDQSSDFGVDHIYGGAPKAGSIGRLGGRASVSRSMRVRVAKEGATSRRRAWRPRTSVTQTVKMGRKRWFPSHTPVIRKGEAYIT